MYAYLFILSCRITHIYHTHNYQPHTNIYTHIITLSHRDSKKLGLKHIEFILHRHIDILKTYNHIINGNIKIHGTNNKHTEYL